MTYKLLLEPILSDGERAILQLQMARCAYSEWCIAGQVVPSWDALPQAEKERWIRAIRGSTRTMLGLLAAATVT